MRRGTLFISTQNKVLQELQNKIKKKIKSKVRLAPNEEKNTIYSNSKKIKIKDKN